MKIEDHVSKLDYLLVLSGQLEVRLELTAKQKVLNDDELDQEKPSKMSFRQYNVD